jgi:peptide/nickel transport system substrate-binding protein
MISIEETTMKLLLATAAVCAAAAFGAADAKPFRWSSQGDPQTSDPHSQNEGLTNLFAQQVHDTLVMRDKKLAIVPGLAVSWTQVNDTTWRFALRQGVKFHDGTPFTADDIVFSIERAQHQSSLLRQYANLLGKPRKIDDYTVELVQANPNPVLLQHATTIYIMSKAWSAKHKVEQPLDFKSGQDSYAARHAMGTGPWILVSREPDIKTVLRRNPNWWGKHEGNLTEITYRPIQSDATRTAALFSGQVDFVLDPPPQDIARIKASRDLKVVEGTENRVVFLGFDQHRDELLYSNVKGKNPFKDKRVRQAVYHAIDIEALRAKTMRGSSSPTGGITPSILASNPDIERRLPYDPGRAKRLLAEAGYPSGFEVGMHCPNNRYINDEEICAAVGAMLARVGIQVKLTTQPRATYFPRLEKFDMSFYMLGWGGAITDAQTTLSPVLRSYDKATGQGSYNYGRYSNAKLDALIDAAAKEMNPDKRSQFIRQALAEHNENVYHVPLHRQVIPWAMRAHVNVVHRADNWLMGEWVSIDERNAQGKDSR